jgi:hypothetical protein
LSNVDVRGRARAAVRWGASDDGATWAFRGSLVAALAVLYVVGRHQWFIRDDWAFVLTREKVRIVEGTSDMLFMAQDGHWMTPPILLFRTVQRLFGIDSYWPFLALAMVSHLAIACMVRLLSLRAGVTPWTATILGALFTVFGSGWEDIVFAVQITYNLSLLAFLMWLWLVDEEALSVARTAASVGAGLICVSSSGFGPFYLLGLAVFLGLHRRWRTLGITVAPAAVAYGWWWASYGRDPAAEASSGSPTQVPTFVRRGIEATFEGLTAFGALAGVAMIATLWVLIHRRHAIGNHLRLAATITCLAMFTGVGIQRIGLGFAVAASSRYVYIAAALLIPVVGAAIDEAVRLDRPALWTARTLFAVSAVVNASWLQSNSTTWAQRAVDERRLLSLVAGSGLAPQADPSRSLLVFSPDVRVADLSRLVADGAIAPAVPTTDAELAAVRAALGLAPDAP